MNVPQTFHLQRPVGRLPRPHGKRKRQEEKQQDLHGPIQNDRTVILGKKLATSLFSLTIIIVSKGKVHQKWPYYSG